jgi:short-subunit dehydrogenase
MHALVTGASSGIGEAFARAFASQHGAAGKLTLVARRRDRLATLAQEVGPCAAHVIERDLGRDLGRLPDLVAAAEAAHGPIDVLVNNAGMHVPHTLLETTAEEGLATLRLNLEAPLLLTRAVLPGMIARGRGTIVDVASMAAMAAYPGMTWYGASKAGLAMASEALRREVAAAGVHVVTVYPGPVHTDMGHNAEKHFSGANAAKKLVVWGTPEELAKRILKAIARKQARVVYPKVYGAAGAVPWLSRALIDRVAPLPDRRGDA